MAMAMASLSSSMSGLSLGSGFSSSSFMGSSLPQPQFPSLKSTGVNPIVRMLLRKWELKKFKDPVKMHVKVGDTIKVIAGSDKGKISEVLRIYHKRSKVLVKDVNIRTKHVKGKEKGESGQIVQVELPVHSSNVMLYSKTAKVASRVGHKTLEDGTKVRYLIKTGEVLDSAEQWKKVHKEKEKKKE